MSYRQEKNFLKKIFKTKNHDLNHFKMKIFFSKWKNDRRLLNKINLVMLKLFLIRSLSPKNKKLKKFTVSENTYSPWISFLRVAD